MKSAKVYQLSRLMTPKRVVRWSELAVLVLLAGVAMASLTWPFGWDQGIFSAMGQIVADGGLPYRDAWELKGPLVFYIYAGVHTVFGITTWGVRVLDIIFAATTAAGLYYLARMRLPGIPSRIVPIVFALWYASGSYWHTAQPDAWAGGLVVGVVVLLTSNRQLTLLRLFGAGLAVGLLGLIKLHYLGFAGLLLLAVVLRRQARLLPALSAGAGLLMPPTLAVAWFLVHHGGPDFWYAYIEWPLTGYSGPTQLPLPAVLAGLRDYIWPVGILLIAAPGIVVGLAKDVGPSRLDRLLLLVWVIIALGSIAIQRRFFVYHWTLAIPPLSLVLVQGLYLLIRATDKHSMVRGVVFGYCILLAIRLSAHPVWEVSQFAAWRLGLQSEEAYSQHFGIGGTDSWVARSLRAEMQAEDQVLVWGQNAGVAYLAGSKAPSRFIFNVPLVSGVETRLFHSFRREYLQAALVARPKFVVETETTGSLVEGYTGLGVFPDLERVVTESYVLERTVGHLRIFRRLEP